MSDLLFILLLSFAISGYLFWGVRFLPAERWQMVATIPLRKCADGQWQGLNLTWYGILSANAYLAAAFIFLLLIGSLGVPLLLAALLVGILLLICIPAASIVAWLVEGKRHTLTVGGAVFVGVITAPWLIEVCNSWLSPTFASVIPYEGGMAAFAIAYAFGEGLGRLACLSFGCCYGKPLQESHPVLQRLFARYTQIFTGATKKSTYASGFDGERLLPVQAMTAILYSATAMISVVLFINQYYTAAFLLSIIVTQLWRYLSEFLRADYRGAGKISAYQIMGGGAIVYSLATACFFRDIYVATPSLTEALKMLWSPLPLLLLQSFWLAIFLHTGRSMVTGAAITFHVNKERI